MQPIESLRIRSEGMNKMKEMKGKGWAIEGKLN